MKILIDARLWGLENTGLGRYTINLVERLKNQNRKNNYIILLRKKYFNELKFPKNWQKVLAESRHYSIKEQVEIPKLISKKKPDLVHFLHFNIPLLFKGNFVVTIHDILWHKQKGTSVTTLPPHIYAAKYVGYKLVFSKAIYASKKIIVPSQSVKNELLDYYANLDREKIVVTYEGIDERLLSNTANKKIPKKYNLKTPYFIYAGNAYPHKNLPRAIEAIIRLNKVSKKKILFAIACSRDIFLERLERFISESEAGDFVKVLGYVSDNDLGALYNNSLGLLYPSFSEGFGLQGLEAIASGTLVLASNIPVFKEVYENNALYFDPYDVSSMAKSMQGAIDMKQEQREKMIKKGQEFIKRYSWDRTAKETLKIYKQSLLLRSKQSLQDTVDSFK